MMIRSVALFAVIAFSVLLTSCTTVSSWFIDTPKVTLSGVKLQNVSFTGATAVFTVKVQNTNPFSMRVHSVSYDLEIGGHHLSQAKIEEGLSVEAHSEANIDVPVPFQFTDLLASASDFIKTGKTTYRLYGEAKISLMTLPFDEKGELKL